MNVLHRPAFKFHPPGPRHCVPAAEPPLPKDDPYAPPEVRAAAVEPPEPQVYMQPPTYTPPSPLEEIARSIRALTYGEMIEFAEALWKLKPEGEITQEMLPGMLHRWAKGGSKE